MLLSGRRIFIVEDNAGNLAIATVHLRTQGASVFYERWGYETPNVISRFLPIHLILMDLMFPNNVSGFDVFDQIKKLPALAHIPVIVVSAADPDEAMPIAREKGFAGFISKPISASITRYVHLALQGKPVWIAESER